MNAEAIMDRIIELEKEFLKQKMINPRSLFTKSILQTYLLNVRLHNQMTPKIRRYSPVIAPSEWHPKTLEE